MTECSCAEADRNRRARHSAPATDGPNVDGEILCRFCWEILEVLPPDAATRPGQGGQGAQQTPGKGHDETSTSTC